MQLHFTKMHGLGNDFIVLDQTQQAFQLDEKKVCELAHRQLGIGFDQLLIVQAPSTEEVEFDYRIFNADGEEVEHCGNGARCFAKFVLDKGLTQNRLIKVHTAAGNIELLVNDDETVTVQMGVPIFEPSLIPFSAESESSSYTLELEDECVEITALAIGNPHAVVIVPNVQKAEVLTLGAQIESHTRFPNRVNAGFMEIVSPTEVNVRVFERGVGETLACGTGACAAVVSGIQLGLLEHKVTANLLGGQLHIQWDAPNKSVKMTGPCQSVFEGTIEL
jgi:diaminopimelate epimerase